MAVKGTDIKLPQAYSEEDTPLLGVFVARHEDVVVYAAVARLRGEV